MDIYKNKSRNHNFYRKVYEKNVGTIPIDEHGRTYDIHHIDGNHENNDPVNLIALSIKDHYNTHKKQKDWAACKAISMRMQISPAEKSKLSTLSNLERVKNGTHPTKRMIQNGTHLFLNKIWQKENSKKVLENGTHACQKKWTCEKCNVSGTHSVNYNRYHGDNCGKPTDKKIWVNKNNKTLMINPRELITYTKNGWAVGRIKGIIYKEYNTVICPHCNKSGSGGAMTRYHFNNCKLFST